MKRIAIIGANEFQYPLIEKAQKLGYETHVFAWKANSIGEKAADVFHDISIVEKEKILDVCKELEIIGVASIGSDLAVGTVNYILRNLRIPANPEITDIIATNKYDMRNAFRKVGIPIPNYCIVSDNFSIEKMRDLKYPLIVKPTDRSGSRGIFKVENEESLLRAIETSRSESFEKKAIIEEYFEGDEYSCESVSYEGKHTILAFTKKFTTGSPHFIETGHVEPCRLTNESEVRNIIMKALDALYIKYGASHTEFRINNKGEIMIMEIGARMGGDCIGSDLVPLTTGYDYIKMVLDIGCGKAPDFSRNKSYRRAEIRFIFSEEDLDRYYSVLNSDQKKIYRSYIPEGNISGEISSSAGRHGFYIMVES